MSWIEELDFKTALNEVIRNQRRGNDFVIDPLRFEDLTVRTIKESFISTIKDDLMNGRFHPQNLLAIDYPKSNFVLRPCARPLIEDIVVFQAVTNFVISKIYKKIPKNVSYSFDKTKSKYKEEKTRGIDHWLAFEERTLELCDKYDYLLITDIASFFEHISHAVLKDRLLILNSSEDYTKAVNFLLESLLSHWTQSDEIREFSLPQGPDASRLLADIYLYSVDKKMKLNNKIVWFRYMDDIRLFAQNKHDLRLALIDLVTALRKLKLNLNAKKTNIYFTHDKESLKKVIDPKKSMLSLIDNAFKSRQEGEINLVRDSLIEIYKSARDDKNPFADRHMNFFISHFIDLMKFNLVSSLFLRKLVNDFVELLEEKPHLTNKLCWFLLASARYQNRLINLILRKLINFIRDKKRNLYAWQELIVMDAIRQMIKPDNRAEIKIVRKLRAKSNLSLCQKNLILGKTGNSDDLEEIVGQIRRGEFNYEELRAMGISVQQLNSSIKRRVYDENIHKSYVKQYVSSVHGNKYYGFIFDLPKEDVEPGETTYPG